VSDIPVSRPSTSRSRTGPQSHELGVDQRHADSRFSKIVVNMGVGDALTDRKQIEDATNELSIITGQQPRVNKARKSIAGFKLREGVPGRRVGDAARRSHVGVLRPPARIAIPRIRDFRGLNPNSFDGRGNYTFGLTEQLVFPEISFDRSSATRGMDITICTTTDDDEHARALLAAFGFPFRKQGAQV
jgi:large subunit ribosomal protein L5